MFAASFSLPVLYLWQLLEPYALWGRVRRWNEAPGAGDEFAAYGGAVTLALAIWWLVTWRRERTSTAIDRVGLFGLGVAALGLWLATGRFGRLYYLQTWLPVVRDFRVPARYVLFAQFGLTLSATAGLARVRSMAAQAAHERDVPWAPWVLVALSAVGLGWLAASGALPAPLWSPPSLFGPIAFAVAAVLITLAVRGVRAAVPVLVLACACDLALYGLGGVIAWNDFLTRGQALSYLDAPGLGLRPEEGRLARGGYPNLYALGGYQLLDGYAGLVPQKRLDYRGGNALRVAGVKYAHADFLMGASVGGATPVGKGWFALPTPLPKARLVGSAIVSRDARTDVERIDVTQAALVEYPVDLPPGELGGLRVTREDPGSIDVSVEVPAARLLTLAESFDEGWRAEVDGSSARVERVNGDFLGVLVPAGRHVVNFWFRPPDAGWGLMVAMAAAGVVCWLVMGGASQRA